MSEIYSASEILTAYPPNDEDFENLDCCGGNDDTPKVHTMDCYEMWLRCITQLQSDRQILLEALEYYGGLNWNDPVQKGNCRRFHGEYSEIDSSDWEKDKEGVFIGGMRARKAIKDVTR